MKILVISSFLSLCFLHSVSLASTEKNMGINDIRNLSMRDLLDISIVSGASKYVQKTNDAPASINILTADDIKHYGYRNVVELLASIRGFFNHDDGIYEGIGIRGFYTEGDYGSRILVLLDGHKINESMTGSAALDREFPQDIDLIQRVEIVHGPSSSLYGNSAFLAVVNIISKRGKDVDGTKVSIELAEDQRLQGRVTQGGQLKNGLDYLFSATLSNASGTDQYVAYFDNGVFSPDGISHERDFNNIQHLFGKVHYGDWSMSAAYIDSDTGISQPYVTGVYDSPTHAESVHTYLDVAWQHQFSDTVQAETRLSYNYSKYQGYFYPYSSETDLTLIELAEVEKDSAHWWNGDGQLQWQKNKHHIIAGFEFQFHRQQFLKNIVTPFNLELTNEQAKNDHWSVYLQDEITLNKQFIINAGLRYDHHDKLGGTSNPRLALIYKPNSYNTLKFLAGTAFRAPSAYETEVNDPLFLKKNPNLQAETINTYEMAWRHQFDKRTDSLISFYRYQAKALLSFNLDLKDGLLFYDNLGQINGQGLDIEFNKRWKNGLEAHFAYSYQEVEDSNTGVRSSGSPRSLIKLRMGMPVYKHWFLGMNIHHRSSIKTYKAPFAELEGFTQMNLTLSGDIHKNLAISASVYNVLGNTYEYALGNQFNPDRYQINNRGFRLKMTYSFD
jgi:iron complex outermembrane receptor protein